MVNIIFKSILGALFFSSYITHSFAENVISEKYDGLNINSKILFQNERLQGLSSENILEAPAYLLAKLKTAPREYLANSIEFKISDALNKNIAPYELVPAEENTNKLPINLYAFNRVKVDYEVNENKTCIPKLRLTGNIRDYGASNVLKPFDVIYGDKNTLDTKLDFLINFSGAVINKKSINYYLRKFLRIGIIEDWYYRNTSGVTYVQKQFSQDISSLSLIELVVPKNQSIEGLILRVTDGANKNYLIKFGEPASIEVLVDGSSRMLYEAEDKFKNEIAGFDVASKIDSDYKNKLILNEVIISFKSDGSTQINNELKSIGFYSKNQGVERAKFEILSDKRIRMTSDIKAEGVAAGLELNKIVIEPSDFKKNGTCDFKLISARLENVYSKESPIYLTYIDEWNEYLGLTPQSNLIHSLAKTIDPGIKAFISFEFNEAAIKNFKAENRLVNLAEYSKVATNERKLPIYTVHEEFWPLNLRLKANTKILFKSIEKIFSGHAINGRLITTDGKTIVFSSNLNKYSVLNGVGTDIIGLYFSSPYINESGKRVIRDITIFEPNNIELKEAIGVKVPLISRDYSAPHNCEPDKINSLPLRSTYNLLVDCPIFRIGDKYISSDKNYPLIKFINNRFEVFYGIPMSIKNFNDVISASEKQQIQINQFEIQELIFIKDLYNKNITLDKSSNYYILFIFLLVLLILIKYSYKSLIKWFNNFLNFKNIWFVYLVFILLLIFLKLTQKNLIYLLFFNVALILLFEKLINKIISTFPAVIPKWLRSKGRGNGNTFFLIAMFAIIAMSLLGLIGHSSAANKIAIFAYLSMVLGLIQSAICLNYKSH